MLGYIHTGELYLKIILMLLFQVGITRCFCYRVCDTQVFWQEYYYKKKKVEKENLCKQLYSEQVAEMGWSRNCQFFSFTNVISQLHWVITFSKQTRKNVCSLPCHRSVFKISKDSKLWSWWSRSLIFSKACCEPSNWVPFPMWNIHCMGRLLQLIRSCSTPAEYVLVMCA